MVNNSQRVYKRLGVDVRHNFLNTDQCEPQAVNNVLVLISTSISLIKHIFSEHDKLVWTRSYGPLLFNRDMYKHKSITSSSWFFTSSPVCSEEKNTNTTDILYHGKNFQLQVLYVHFGVSTTYLPTAALHYAQLIPPARRDLGNMDRIHTAFFARTLHH